MRHAFADDSPLQRAQHLPVTHTRSLDHAARGLVAGKQGFGRAEAAYWQIGPAEAPGVHADPAQIFHAVAHVGQFPVEHGA